MKTIIKKISAISLVSLLMFMTSFYSISCGNNHLTKDPHLLLGNYMLNKIKTTPINDYPIVTFDNRYLKTKINFTDLFWNPTINKTTASTKTSNQDTLSNEYQIIPMSQLIPSTKLASVSKTLIEYAPYNNSRTTDFNPDNYYFTIGLSYNLSYAMTFKNDNSSSSATFSDNLLLPLDNTKFKVSMYSALSINNALPSDTETSNDRSNFNVLMYWIGDYKKWDGIGNQSFIKNQSINNLPINNIGDEHHRYSAVSNLNTASINLSAHIYGAIDNVVINGSDSGSQQYSIGFDKIKMTINYFYFTWHHV